MNTQTAKDDHHDHHHKPFSALVFFVTILVTLGGYFLAVRLITPVLWHEQWKASFWKWFATFNVFHFLYGLFEGPFHRYVLRSKFLWFGHLHTQHSRHHDLTRIGINGMEEVHNEYAIEKEHQHEASYFPGYSLAAFIGLSWIVVVPLQHILPSWPICLGSVLALSWSLSLYEIVHMIEHLPRETFWDPKLKHQSIWVRRFWTRLYTPHLRHHENIWTNENISGFYTIPVWDILMNSYARWKVAYAHKQKVSREEFKAGLPRRNLILRFLDWGHLEARHRASLREEEVRARNKRKLDRAIKKAKKASARAEAKARKTRPHLVA